MSNVFLLGCERSGSTWLANIFDAHPDVELWMEPFADYAELFPGVPDRNTWVGEPSPELETALHEGYARLPGLKYPLLHRPGASPRLRRAEQRLLRTARRWLRRVARTSPRALERYELLQLNAVETPVARLARKRSRPACRVTKELRLNFKAGLLHGCFPEARFIVATRHPGAQVSSILSWLERGRLGELARTLESFEARLREQERLEPFARALGDLPARSGPEGKLAAWWAINYSVLLGDLEAGGVQHRVVQHERLSRATAQEAAELLAFAGLPPDPAVEDYLAWSSAGAPQGDSPTETVRHSAEHSRDSILGVSEPVKNAVEAVLERLRDADQLHPALTARVEA
jgi:hypothetical protein